MKPRLYWKLIADRLSIGDSCLCYHIYSLFKVEEMITFEEYGEATEIVRKAMNLSSKKSGRPRLLIFNFPITIEHSTRIQKALDIRLAFCKAMEEGQEPTEELILSLKEQFNAY